MLKKIAELQKNGRASYKVIAKKLNLSGCHQQMGAVFLKLISQTNQLEKFVKAGKELMVIK